MMSELTIFQVHAFADGVFEGNPAAIVPLEKWLPDEMMLTIAAENNLGATAFFVPEGDGFALRWFTPAAEIPLCGHATLASAHVLFTHLGFANPEITFQTKSGSLTVGRDGDLYVMDFPSNMPKPTMVPDGIADVLGARPVMVLKSKSVLAVFEDMRQVAALQPDLAKLTRFCNEIGMGLIATAPGDEASGWDCASRFFAPHLGIPEDPVTGSAHTVIVPFWAKRLGKDDITARQISKRGGTLFCTLKGDRILMRGRAVDYLKGTITV
jgi:PhzF family phenazine biosynthesis protein